MAIASIGALGVYIQEMSGGSRPLVAVWLSTAGFIGTSPKNEKNGVDSANFEANAIDN